jgi:hypothetical protein
MGISHALTFPTVADGACFSSRFTAFFIIIAPAFNHEKDNDVRETFSSHIQVKEESQVQKSPKMKLKYLKGIFPAADETFLLDVLSSCENNVQKASEKMLKKGFTRTPPAK